MGSQTSNLQENEQSVYDILETNEKATPEEIKKQYHKMLLKYHPNINKTGSSDHIIKIKDAYNKLKENEFRPIIKKRLFQIDFTKYNRKYFTSLEENKFYEIANKLYDSIIDNEKLFVENVVLPRFGDKSSIRAASFYLFYRGFKTCIKFEKNYTGRDKKYYEKEHDKTQKKIYNDNVRNLTKLLQGVDPRMKKMHVFEDVKQKIERKPVEKKKRVEKNIDKYLYYCDACLKGFMSDKTMINHLKGEKHKEKIKEKGMYDLTFEEIEEERRLLQDEGHEDEESDFDISKDILNTHIDNHNEDGEFDKNDEDSKDVLENDSNENEKLEKEFEKLKINKKTSDKKNKKPRRAIRKKGEDLSRESQLHLKCANCNKLFQSRNLLFAHIRSGNCKK